MPLAPGPVRDLRPPTAAASRSGCVRRGPISAARSPAWSGQLAELFASTFPRRGIEWKVGAAGGPRVLGIAELESIRDALAGPALRRSCRDRAPGRGRGEQPRPGRADDRRPGRAPLGPGQRRGRRRAELQALALAAAMGPARHARRLVAGQALLRLSLSLRVVPKARPAPKIDLDRRGGLMASSKSRKRRKRRPRTPPERAAAPAEASETQAEPAGRQAARRGSVPPDSEAPPAPWGSFPLVELCVLAGIVMLILGFFVVGGSRGPILIAAGLALGSIGGLELSIREHFAGYNSHTAVLAGVPALIVLGAALLPGARRHSPARAGGHRRGGLRGRGRAADPACSATARGGFATGSRPLAAASGAERAVGSWARGPRRRPGRRPRAVDWTGDGQRRAASFSSRAPASASLLTQRQPAELSILVHGQRHQELTGPRAAPARLAAQQLGDRHGLRLPWTRAHNLLDRDVPGSDRAFQGGACESNPVGVLEGTDMLRHSGWRSRRGSFHTHSSSCLRAVVDF